MNIVHRGNIVRTNYNTGPFLIIDVDGPCTCPEYLAHINGNDTPSEPHYHMTCTKPDGTDRFWLNGYRLNGTCVWNGDRVVLVGTAQQGELFA